MNGTRTQMDDDEARQPVIQLKEGSLATARLRTHDVLRRLSYDVGEAREEAVGEREGEGRAGLERPVVELGEACEAVHVTGANKG